MLNPFDLKTNDEHELKIKKAILFAIGVLGIILLVAIIHFIINLPKTSKIEILVAPKDAVVEIGDKKFGTEKTIRIEPGTYKVKIHREGFIDYEGEIEAKKDETSYILEYLIETESTKNYYKNNDDDHSRRQTIEDLRADHFKDNSNMNSDKIFSLTPFDDYVGGYKITAKDEGEKTTLTIYIYTCNDENADDYKRFKGNALKHLEDIGININNYTVKYTQC